MEMVESIRRATLDRTEVSGFALLVTYAALALGMYLQYVTPH